MVWDSRSNLDRPYPPRGSAGLASFLAELGGTTMFRTGFLRAQSSCEEAAWTHRQLVQLSGSRPALEVFRHVWRAWAQFSHDANWRAEQLWTEALISPQAGTWARYRLRRATKAPQQCC